LQLIKRFRKILRLTAFPTGRVFAPQHARGVAHAVKQWAHVNRRSQIPPSFGFGSFT